LAIRILTLQQHTTVLKRLVRLAKRFRGGTKHSAGFEYSSLMTCFLMNNVSSAEAILALGQHFGEGWFPVPAGYSLTRLLFETEVTAHYLARDPVERSRKYVDFANVLRKREMDAHAKHRNSSHPSWKEAMQMVWDLQFAEEESEINRRYAAVISSFEQPADRKGKKKVFEKWSGLSIRQMALKVDHEEAYDVFYSFLSSFSHADIRVADRFLKLGPGGPVWSMKAEEFDVGNVFRYAAIFLTCFLQLFGREFGTWSEKEVDARWDF